MLLKPPPEAAPFTEEGRRGGPRRLAHRGDDIRSGSDTAGYGSRPRCRLEGFIEKKSYYRILDETQVSAKVLRLKHHMAFRIISSEEEVDDDKVEVDLDKNMVFPWKTRSVAELDGGEPWRWKAPGLKPPLEPATVPPLSP